MTEFNPNEACAPNNHYFGFPYYYDECPLVLVSVPWDVTTSYRAGAAHGPQAILDASVQLDFFDFEIPDAWKLGIGTYPVEESRPIAELSAKMRPVAERQIAFSEGRLKRYSQARREADRRLLEESCQRTNAWLEAVCDGILQENRYAAVVGGDHSSPYGLLKALSHVHEAFGILHLDAHADLRKAYEGFTFSHASIMYNALQLKQVMKLVQVGVRDVCQDEQDYAASQGSRVKQFPDIDLHKRLYQGETWHTLCEEIISALPEKVYVSFDIDALQPSLCPHTGTPVPGGLDFAQVRYLLSLLRQSGKRIIGFDLSEVAPAPTLPRQQPDEWDGNVGARVLYMLSNTLLASLQ